MRFLRLLQEAQAGQKDSEAEALIRDAVARQPDAAYLLVQRVMQLEFALEASQSEAGQLKRELAQTRTGRPASSFLGSPNEWGRRPAASAGAAQSNFQPAMTRDARPATQPAPAAAAPASSWGSGLMGTVASTAAGVVAGSLLAQGIGSLMGRHNNDHAAIPPGGGKVDDADRYGDASSNQSADGGYAAEDFDTSDAGGVAGPADDVG